MTPQISVILFFLLVSCSSFRHSAERRCKVLRYRLSATSTSDVLIPPPQAEQNFNLPKIVPSFDELDVRITKLALPAIINLALVPLVGAVDTFWFVVEVNVSFIYQLLSLLFSMAPFFDSSPSHILG